MHAAPSVSYPVGRSAFVGALHAGVFLLAVAAIAAWTLQPGAFQWRHGLAWVTVVTCGAWALAAWLRSPAGTLRWDGAAWQWQPHRGDAQAGAVVLALDLQSHLLLRWRADGRATRWFWLERESALADWDALRRAVYSRASAPLPTPPRGEKGRMSEGAPPAAEQ